MPDRPRKSAPPTDPDQFDEAVEYWRSRVPVSDEEWEALTDAERRMAVKVAVGSQGDLVQRVFNAIDSAVANGTTLDTFKKNVGAELEESWGGSNPARIESVFRTSVMSAYNGGRRRVMTAPAVKRARPYWRHDYIDDNRGNDCPICSPLDGLVLPADDPFWKKHACPLHPGCRCQQTPLTPEEAEEEGIAEEAPDSAAPATGFGEAPDEEGVDWEPDPDAYDPSIRSIVRDRLPE